MLSTPFVITKSIPINRLELYVNCHESPLTVNVSSSSLGARLAVRLFFPSCSCHPSPTESFPPLSLHRPILLFIYFLIIFLASFFLEGKKSFLWLAIRQINFWLFAGHHKGQRENGKKFRDDLKRPTPMMTALENFTAPTQADTHRSCVSEFLD